MNGMTYLIRIRHIRLYKFSVGVYHRAVIAIYIPRPVFRGRGGSGGGGIRYIRYIRDTYYFYRLTLVSPSFTAHEAGTSLDRDGDMKVGLF